MACPRDELTAVRICYYRFDCDHYTNVYVLNNRVTGRYVNISMYVCLVISISRVKIAYVIFHLFLLFGVLKVSVVSQ